MHPYRLSRYISESAEKQDHIGEIAELSLQMIADDGPSSAYVLCKKITEAGRSVAYKNVNQSVRKLENSEFIELAHIEGTHAAKKYQITLGGWIYLLSNSTYFFFRAGNVYKARQESATLTFRQFLPISYTKSALFKELVEAYFENESLELMPIDAYSMILHYMRDCTKELISDAKTLKSIPRIEGFPTLSSDDIISQLDDVIQRHAKNFLLHLFMYVFISTPESIRRCRETIPKDAPEYSTYEETTLRFMEALRNDRKFSKYVLELEDKISFCFSNFKKTTRG
jgi:hypothetical protein